MSLTIGVVMGSVRPNRFNEKAALWISEILKKRENVVLVTIDPRDFDLPLYHESSSPSMVKDGAYPNPVAQKLAVVIKACDAFVIVAAEYNHSVTGVLKNLLDHVYAEWNNKAVGFAGYGSVGGARAVEQLRNIAAEVQMASVRTAVHIPAPWSLVDESNTLKAGALDSFVRTAEGMIDQLISWGTALKSARSVEKQ